MKGVTQRVFTEWLTANGQPSRDVRTITDAELTAIYRERYWDIAKLGTRIDCSGWVRKDIRKMSEV